MRTAARIPPHDTGSREGHRFSHASVVVLLGAFVAGVVEGAVSYAGRAGGIKPQGGGTNAITVHLVVAFVWGMVVVVVEVYRSRQLVARRWSPWTAPLSAHAMARLVAMARPARAGLLRAVPTVPLVLVIIYAPFRMGAQMIGGIDPNATVNAWGGPSYLGALLAHWLDCVVGFYAAAFFLSRLLPSED